MPGQLHGCILRSPHAHASIKSIDTTRAEKLKGVKAVVTRKDFKAKDVDPGLLTTLDNCMAGKTAFYDGHAVAAVAAIDAKTARRALQLIKIEYKILKHVTDVDEAVKPKAPVIDKKCFTKGVEPKPEKASNIANRSEFGHGDVEQGFAAADIVIERNYRTEQSHQGYIEPHACVASYSPDGTAEMWVCTQGHFDFRAQIEPVTLALSRKANRPVKLVMTRDEVFRASGPTSATSIDIRMGVTKDGTITAAEAELRYTSGPYAGSWARLGAMTSFACYDLEHVKTVGLEVLVNRPKTTAYRAPSAPMAAFAVESTIDELADRINMPAIDLRIKNAAKEGSRSSYGPVYGPIGIGPTLEAAKNHPHMKAKLGPNQSRGMACGFWFNFGGQSCTNLNINPDGTATLSFGTIDVGGARASMALVVAEELGIPYEQVKAVVADTGSLGHNDMTDGSRGTFASSMSAINSCRMAITELRKRAAELWGIDTDDVTWQDGEARATGTANASLEPLTLANLAQSADKTGGPIAGHSQIVADGAGVSFATHICDLEVDPETGLTRVVR